MTPRYLLDTNVIIALLRDRSPRLRDRLTAESGRVAVSAISVAELYYGIERSSDPTTTRIATDGLLPLTTVLPLDRAAAEHSGEIRASPAQAGTPIGGYGLLIAGQARSAGMTVVTNNLREFTRVPGLLVEDWTA